ncbi:glutamine-hydrolyzing carbamoyl-phosphate synthase small subunit [Pontibacter sp. G13]|uniref:glutamine-hydrolyzing carbamoyl-phosphate synthase small subunit n=1 Tax=Pontibacter sp. G13 TaxID=3074898 RepID=UPI00288BD86E|nr:glutamine-hydrolyzing carbamoyl-phosphate synthase small subunit [Pontibacter sp. G13]WNJ19005.1 glutamine-hydrolyzing carbamoyl-phosphate synthase small subunit [Pontibacter sp. G13]
MKYIHKEPAYLLLEDGLFFEGYAIGKKGTTTGELCFNTSMTGYQEVFTDPSYYGQILIETHTHVGNYGVHGREYESSSAKISGLVVRNFSRLFSRTEAVESLDSFLKHNNTVGISDVDTRFLVTHIRDKGAMNAIISSEISDKAELERLLKQCPPMEGLELSSKVSTIQPYFHGNPNSPYRVAVLDVGVKSNILECLAKRGCYLKVFPADTPYEELASFDPHGFFISNGPGDPAAMPYAVETVKRILEADLPLFGICLGHQVISLACGVKTYKMHNGHRGANHPVKNLLTGHCEITSQNHGFCVDREEIERSPNVVVTHVNLNDQTIEGIRVRNKKAFSVQFHPEASPGPHDSHYLFDQFLEMMEADAKERTLV